MRITLILVTLILEIHLYSIEGKARQQQQPQRESSINNNAIVPIDSFVNREIAGGDGGIGDEELVIPSTEVTAQKGGTATLPCKFTEPGAGINLTMQIISTAI
ncbi:hypothetical protein PV326_008004 [Microctonus aethiopoides]|nr:hypothetical protein PV326_008004 [Microctonus aethiopoides]